MRHLVFVTAFALVACFAAAQSPPLANEPDYQQIRTNDALETIASQLSAIREQAARIEKARADREANTFWPPVWSNWMLILLTGGAVIAAFKTLGKMERQTKAAEDAARAASVSADAAKVSADASVAQATFTVAQKRNMDRQLEQMNESLAIAKVNADAAKLSADTAAEALYVAEAADLQIAQIIVETPPGRPATVVSTDCTLVLEFKNFGRTRAVSVRGDWHLGIPGVTDFQPIGNKETIEVSANGSVYLKLGRISDACSSEQWEEVRFGRMPLRFWGSESYRDVFKRERKMTSQGSYKPPNDFSIDVTKTE